MNHSFAIGTWYWIKPLPLPPEVVGLNRSQVRQLLALSDSQLRRDTRVLQHICEAIPGNPRGWRYIKGARGYRRSAIACLWVFRQLVQKMGRSNAIACLCEVMEEYRDG